MCFTFYVYQPIGYSYLTPNWLQGLYISTHESAHCKGGHKNLESLKVKDFISLSPHSIRSDTYLIQLEMSDSDNRLSQLKEKKL